MDQFFFRCEKKRPAEQNLAIMVWGGAERHAADLEALSSEDARE